MSEHWAAAGHEVTVSTDVAKDLDAPYMGPAAVHHRPGPWELFQLWKDHDVVVHMMVGLKSVWPAALRANPSVFAHQSTYWLDRSERRDWREKLKLHIAAANPWNICVSRFVREATVLRESVVVPNCYDDAIFWLDASVPRDREIVFVGRLVSDKGADLLLEAVSRCDGGKALSVTIVGGGPEEAALRRQAVDLGVENVRFTGSLPPREVADELRRHRLMVVPSLWREPFGIVALEGMACGAVPLVADGGGLPEAVGDAGMVFRRGDAEDLALKLSQLLSSHERQQALRERAKSHLREFTAAKMCDAYLDMALQAVNANKR
ncbi:MAG: glycosyltransferase family 4 protein [Luteolibacter sp.]